MILAYPDFYPRFRCRAGDCGHSCCRGWEIDIDAESLEYYRGVPGEFGKRLRGGIAEGPEPHFLLREDESCPFLNRDGLCELILELGEDSLCDICAEHPRFYREYPGRTETGLGLCCEEAVRLLTEGREPLRIIEEDDGEGEPEEALPEVLKLRERVFAVLAESGTPLVSRMKRAMRLTGTELRELCPAGLADFYEGLERMEPAWGDMLKSLRKAEPTEPEGVRWERTAEYFVYRHLTDEDGRGPAAALQFAFLSTRIVNLLEKQGFGDEALRLYSAEIEYSDENVEKIMDYLEQ